jgi:3-oxoacyl-[acyl-carrier-protein] synthase II
VKAAVTGWAWRTPLGNEIEPAMRRLLAGERAAVLNPHFDPSGYLCQLVAPVHGQPAPSRNGRFLDRLALLAMDAAIEAIAGSGRKPDQRFGVFAAVGGLRAHLEDLIPTLQGEGRDAGRSWRGGLARLHPFWLLTHLSNNAHALLSAEVGGKGEGATFAGATAGAQALAAAIRALEAGAIDAACVVGYDSLIEPEVLLTLGEEGGARGTGPVTAPYDQRAAGIVPGQGAAALVLERVGDAPGRGQAFVSAASAADGAKGQPDAATLGRVTAVLGAADVVDGAARAHPRLDSAEREVLANIVGPAAALVAVTGTMGSLGAATALVQAIALAHMLKGGMLAPIAGLQDPAAGPLVPVARPSRTRARAGLALSTGSPGLAAAVRVEIP